MHEHERWVNTLLKHFPPEGMPGGVPATEVERQTGISARSVRLWRNGTIGVPLRDNVRRALQTWIEGLEKAPTKRANSLEQQLHKLADEWDEIHKTFAASLRRAIAIVPVSGAVLAEEARQRGERAIQAAEAAQGAKERSERKPQGRERRSNGG